MKPLILTHKQKQKDGTFQVISTEYYPVKERVLYFRENFRDHRIITTVLNLADKFCVIRAEIIDGNGNIISTGHAVEFREANNINMYSFIENCETSAVGRALGFLAIGIENGIASEEEIKKSLHLEEPCSAAQATMIEELVRTSTLPEEEKTKIENAMFNFNNERASKCIEYLKANQQESLDQEFKRKTK